MPGPDRGENVHAVLPKNWCATRAKSLLACTRLATNATDFPVLATFMRYVPLGATADHFTPLYSTDLSQVQFLVNNKIARVANKL